MLLPRGSTTGTVQPKKLAFDWAIIIHPCPAHIIFFAEVNCLSSSGGTKYLFSYFLFQTTSSRVRYFIFANFAQKLRYRPTLCWPQEQTAHGIKASTRALYLCFWAKFCLLKNNVLSLGTKNSARSSLKEKVGENQLVTLRSSAWHILWLLPS